MVAPDTVFFLSDYGLRDEFVGVVHAVLRRLAPTARVIDLTHEIPPFDVRAGSAALRRALPYLGPGVVLAVVDPGVGGERHGIALRCPVGSGRPALWVGPDNGLLLAAAEDAGGIEAAVVLRGPGSAAGGSDAGVRDGDSDGAVTFDGRDLFAPAVGALCGGAPLQDLGTPVAAKTLVRVPEPVLQVEVLPDGSAAMRTEVTWVDRFGNVQLSASGDQLPLPVGEVVVSVDAPPAPLAEARWFEPCAVRRVRTYGELEIGEPGLLVDANGQVALVAREGSAAGHFGVGTGSLVQLVCEPA